MARACSAATPAYISAGSIPGNVGSNDRTFSCWVMSTGTISTRQIFYREGDNGGHIFMEINGSEFRVTGDVAVLSGTTPSQNVWYHVLVTCISGTSSIYINGTFGASGSITLSTSGTTFFLGAGAGGALPLTGPLAEVAKWNVGLGTAEITALSKRISPLRIRPAQRAFYAPLVRSVYDAHGLALTDTNTTAFDHPPTIA